MCLDKADQFYLGIHGLRGWAALCVLLYHADILFRKDKYFGSNLFFGIFEVGYHGVDLFFVISGFLMAMLKKKSAGIEDAKSFALARIKRIYLPYLPIFVALSSACFLTTGVCPVAYSFDIRSIFLGVFLLPREDISTFVPVVAWTLAHELFFYVMICLSIALKNFGKKLLMVWIFISAFVALASFDLVFPFTFLFSKYNLAFALGMLAFASVKYIKSPGAFKAIRTTGLVMVIALSAVEINRITQHNKIAELLLELGFFIASFLLVLGGANSSRGSLQILGNSSYSVYLIHYPVLVLTTILAVKFLGVEYNKYFMFIIVCTVALLASFAYYYLVEKPLVNASRRAAK